MRQTNECPFCHEHAVVRTTMKVARGQYVEVTKCASCGRTADGGGQIVPDGPVRTVRKGRGPVPRRASR